MSNYVFQKNDQYIEIALTDGLTGLPLTGATAKATLVDRNNVNVDPVVDLPLLEVDTTPGLYRGIVSHDFEAPVGVGYHLWINVVTSSGLEANIQKPFCVGIRTS